MICCRNGYRIIIYFYPYNISCYGRYSYYCLLDTVGGSGGIFYLVVLSGQPTNNVISCNVTLNRMLESNAVFALDLGVVGIEYDTED